MGEHLTNYLAENWPSIALTVGLIAAGYLGGISLKNRTSQPVQVLTPEERFRDYLGAGWVVVPAALISLGLVALAVTK